MTADAIPAARPLDGGALRNAALAAAAVGAALLAVGFAVHPLAAARSYLWAYLWVLGMALGSLVLVMLQYLTGGAWGTIIRRPAEAAMRTLPALAVLFLPVAFTARTLYPWADPEIVAGDAALQHKEPYLNLPFFWARAAVYFAVWVGLALIFDRWSRRQDESNPPGWDRRFRLLAGPGLALYGLTITFAAIDWVMSLQPHWFSSIFGVIIGSGQLLSGLSFCIVVVLLLADRPPYRGVLVAGHLRDLGNLLLAFVMLWAYIGVSQLIIIWSGNTKEEVSFYVVRTEHGWQFVAAALFFFQYALPFLVLLSRDAKRNPQRLLIVAALTLGMRLVDLLWLTAPDRPLDQYGSTVAWTDPVALVALGGLWLAMYVWELGRRPLLPLNADSAVVGDHHG